MHKLVTLNGKPTNGILKNPSNRAAGLVFWKSVADEFPGITWGDIANGALNNATLNGNWLTRSIRRTKNAVGGTIMDVGRATGKIIDYAGKKSGSALRLAENVGVLDTIKGMISPSSGVVDSVKSMFGGGENPIDQAGKEINAAAAGGSMGMMDPKILLLGFGGVASVILLMNLKKVRR